MTKNFMADYVADISNERDAYGSLTARALKAGGVDVTVSVNTWAVALTYDRGRYYVTARDGRGRVIATDYWKRLADARKSYRLAVAHYRRDAARAEHVHEGRAPWL